MPQPFMEHPSGQFTNAVDAMADAITRLRAQSTWTEWITFCAQGMGPRIDTYHMAELHMRADVIDFNQRVDIDTVTKAAAVPSASLAEQETGYSIATATPEQAAKMLDVIFRRYMGIRPHTGEGDDYAVGVEW